ncbi:MAG: glycosyltransferase family 4 protein [Syntrophaceae bacterium]
MKSAVAKIGIFEPYLNGNIYGNQKYILGIFKYMVKNKYEPILISQDYSVFLDKVFQQDGTTAVVLAPLQLRRFGGQLGGKNIIMLIKTFYSILLYTKDLYRFIKNSNIDVIQCHSIRALLVVALSAQLAGKPKIWYVKGELSNPILDRIGFFVADIVLFQSETNMRLSYTKIISRYSNKIKIIPNGVDIEEIEAFEKKDHAKLIEELCLDDTRTNICYIGRVTPQKGIHVLIEAVAMLSKTIPNITIYVVGDFNVSQNSYMSTINRLIDSSGLDVRFTGFRTDALEILSLMDLFVLPSFSEGFPRTIMEAMALGKPVISTAVGGITEFLKDDNKIIIVPPGDSEALAEAIRVLLNNKGLRETLSVRGRRYLYEHHSIQRNSMGLMDIYESVLSK